MKTTHTITSVTTVAALAFLALTGCAAQEAQEVADDTNATATSSVTINPSEAPSWDNLSSSQRDVLIREAESKQNALLIWQDHVEWLDENYPTEQKAWVENQVKEFADTDGPVKAVESVGSEEKLKVVREYTKADGSKESVDVFYKTFLENQKK